MYRMKSTVQSSTWNHLDVDEKIEQLIEVNDSLFERIVRDDGTAMVSIVMVI